MYLINAVRLYILGHGDVGGGVLEGHTHPEKLESLESLARDNRDELHFT